MSVVSPSVATSGRRVAPGRATTRGVTTRDDIADVMDITNDADVDASVGDV